MAFTLEIIRTFKIYKLIIINSGDKNTENFLCKNQYEYSTSSEEDENKELEIYHHVPLILDSDYKPWFYGNIFIINLLRLGRNIKTADSYAKTLKLFMNFCEEGDIDYLQSVSRIRSPIARYRRHLEDRNRNGEIKASYIKEILSKVVMFYRYLENEINISFESCPWWQDEDNTYFLSKDNIILKHKVISSEIQKIKGATRKTSEIVTFEGSINDSGEQLRPLEKKEIRIVFQALREISNIEMTLAHKIIFTTGARTQTIFTLRQCYFQEELTAAQTEVVIKAGNGSLVDSKQGHIFYVRINVKVYLEIQNYIRSERAQRRYANSKNNYEDPSHQYIFVTQQGNPFYISNCDLNRVEYTHPPVGQALTVFINNILKPKLKKLGFDNPQKTYKFHDLRATFGLLRLESFLQAMPEDIPANQRGIYLDKAITQTQKLMNHANRSTTLHYLNVRKNTELVKNANKSWNEYLERLMKHDNEK